MMKKTLFPMMVLSLLVFSVQAQESRQALVDRIFKEALTHPEGYYNLGELSRRTAGRISGTPEAAAAVEFTRQLMLSMHADSVWLQPVMVPHWVRGKQEKGMILSKKFGQTAVPVTALGTSPGTDPAGISAPVVEVQSLDEVNALGEKKLSGKIVFFNRPMDPTLLSTFAAYGGAVDQRTRGAALAATYGAVAVVVRSLTTLLDDVPHTGVTVFREGEKKIPAVAISTLGAERLHTELQQDPETSFYLFTGCKNEEPVVSYNVIGEIRGTVFPDQIITIGGHLDAWDTGEGAHDDGAGCIHALEVMRLFRSLNIKPRHTIRIVMFMNEEISQTGGKKYAAEAEKKGEKHILALESDRGGFIPRGFGISAPTPELQDSLMQMKQWFKSWGITEFREGGGGSDVGPLRALGAGLIGFIPDPQRYFDVHHSASDNFSAVNQRELELGSAGIASLIWLADQLEY